MLWRFPPRRVEAEVASLRAELARAAERERLAREELEESQERVEALKEKERKRRKEVLKMYSEEEEE